MNRSDMDVIVIGAGHAGLSISYYLKQQGLKHVVFEKHKVGHSWQAQRWDSFKLNTPNKTNMLPGMKDNHHDPDGFSSARDFVKCLENYVEEFKLPVHENCCVTALEKPADSEFFQATVTQDQKEQVFKSKKAVIASGAQNKKIIPPLAANIPGHILQLHACEYRNPAALPQGSVLVIGSAQSGVQICEDLLEAGRKVYLSSSMVARMPRRYRGKDLIEWMILTGIMDIETDKVPDPQMLTARQPLVSGVGVRGRTVSLQGLARKGAVILGKMDNADAQGARFKSNAPEHIKFADDFSQNLKNMVDEYISKTQIDSELPQKDPEDLPDKEVASVSSATSLNFKKDHITSVIWATGFTGDYNYLKFPVFNNDGSIKHLNGVTDIKGLYVLGFPWLRKRKSGIVLGIDEDARFISEKLKEAI